MPSFSTTHVHAWVDCKTVGFFLRISKEINNAWRMRANRVSLYMRLWACETREKKPTVRFPYNEIVPTRGFKNVVELSEICSQSRPLYEIDTLGD